MKYEAYSMPNPVRLASFLVVGLLALGVSAQETVRTIERERIAIPGPSLATARTLRLRLTLVNVAGSGWTRERALDALRTSVVILAQCEVDVDQAEWVTLATPPQFLDFSTPAARELARLAPLPRPAIYLVRDTRNRPAFDAEAIGRGNSRSRPELADTVWITVSARDAGHVLAHELAHVLMDSGEHTDAPDNLMRDQTASGGDLLTATQCARLRATGRDNGLLTQP